MADILFGHSYFMRFDTKLWRGMQPYPPLGTLFAAAYARERGFDVALFDAMLASGEVAWEQALDAHKPRFAVLFEDNFNYLSKMCLLRMRRAALQMIATASLRGCDIIVCGADATDHAELYLEAGADFVVTGEGEQTLGALLEAWKGPKVRDPEQIAGLVYWDLDRGVKRTPKRQEIRDLDALPDPAWDLVDMPQYQRAWRERHAKFSLNMVTTRGCPYHCNWVCKAHLGAAL